MRCRVVLVAGLLLVSVVGVTMASFVGVPFNPNFGFQLPGPNEIDQSVPFPAYMGRGTNNGQPDGYNFYRVNGNGVGSLTVPVSTPVVGGKTLWTLCNTWWGQRDSGTVTVVAASGFSQTHQYVGDLNIRDYNYHNPGFLPSIGGSTRSIYTGRRSGWCGDCTIDRQMFPLDSRFLTDPIVRLVFDNHYGDNRNDINIYGITIETADPPIIHSQPTDQKVELGSGFRLDTSVEGPSGSGDLSFQWYRNGSPIQGATSRTYFVSSSSQADDGQYYLAVKNNRGTVNTNTVTVTIVAPASVTSGATHISAEVGKPLTVSVSAQGSNLSYQWLKGGMPIYGATAPSFSVAQASLTDAGIYTCNLSNSMSSTVSPPTTVFVYAPEQQKKADL